MKLFQNIFVKGGAEKAIYAVEPSVAHPPLLPNHWFAMANTVAPIEISAASISCRIDYLPADGLYRLQVKSRQKVISTEMLDPADRWKKAVADFVFKGLIGIHLHPSGMVFFLDEEKNFKGEARPNQPPAVIRSGKLPEDFHQQNQRRFALVDLVECQGDKPILISPNKGRMHMQVMPIVGNEDEFGLFLSNEAGIVREESQPAIILGKGKSVVIDRNLLTQLALGESGSLDARVWNKAIEDPILARIEMVGEGQLRVEELFTVNGLTVLTAGGGPVELGLPGGRSEREDREHRQEQIRILTEIRDETSAEMQERSRDQTLTRERKSVVAAVARVLPKTNRDHVSILALELATKEVLAPFYGNPGAGDSVVVVDLGMVRLLNGVVSELVGWVDADSNRAISVLALEQAVAAMTKPLHIEGLEEMMLLELPSVKTKSTDADNVNFADLIANAKRLLADARFIKEVKHIFKDLSHSQDKREQQQLAVQLDQTVRGMIRGVFEKTLVRLAVKGYLKQIEKMKRVSMGMDVVQAIESPLTDRELDSILSRYDAYAKYMDLAFTHRIERSLFSLIKDFQHGFHDEREVNVSTKSFLAYLIALRTAGGKVAMESDYMPIASSLQNIPDAIPDIYVVRVDPAVARAHVRMRHREGVLLEMPFDLVPRVFVIPDGVPNCLWFGFRELSEQIVGYHLTGESHQKKDRKSHDAIVTGLTQALLLGVVNLLRGQQQQPQLGTLVGAVDILAASNGIIETREGAHQEDEFLDLKDRPDPVEVEAISLRQELKKIIVSLQHKGVIGLDTIRFKQHLRAFAMVGAPQGQRVLLPITIKVSAGFVTLSAQFREESFEKVIRLIQENESAEMILADLESTVRNVKSIDVVQREKAIKLRKFSIYKLVHGLPFFNQFSNFEQQSIAEYNLSFRLCQPGEVVIQEGTTDAAFFIIIRGTVRVVKKGDDRLQFGPGDMFGEMAFLARVPQNLGVVALDKVLVLRVDQEMLTRMSSESREKFKDHIIAKQVARLADITRKVGEQMRKSNFTGHLAVADKPVHTNIQGAVPEMDQEQAFKLIDRLAFFSAFPRNEKRRITAFHSSFRAYLDNSEIIQEGATDTAFFVLVRGWVDIIKGDAIIAEMGPGEFFGDMAFLTNTPRTTSVRSRGEVLVLRLNQEIIERLGADVREKIKDRFISKLTDRLIDTSDLMESNSLYCASP